MDGMIYVATSGADQMLHAQVAHAHNLANVNTIGFKADLEQLSAVPITGGSFATRTYVQSNQPITDFTGGPLIATGRPLDVSIKGSGWFVVQAADGSEAYTRNGMFKINQNGLLTTETNLPVLGSGGQITIPPSQKIEIGEDGTVSIIPQEGSTLPVVLDRLKLVNPDLSNVTKGIDGLFVTKDGSQPDPDPNVTVISDTIEGSNVNAVEAITKMISIARQFEMQLKLMNVAQENDQASNSVLALN